MAASLLVSLTIIPFLASRLLQAEGHGAEGNKALQGLMRGIHGIYGPALHVALAAPSARCSRRWPSCSPLRPHGADGLQPVPERRHPAVPDQRRDADGRGLAETDRAVRFVEAELQRHAEVKHVFANVGHGNPQIYYNVFPEEQKANVGEVFVELQQFDPRTTPALLEDPRQTSPSTRRAHHRRELRNGPPLDAPIEVAIVGPDLDALQELANQAEAIMVATPGTRDVDNPARRLRTDLDLRIDADKAALLGVPPVEVDRTVRAAVAGLTVGNYREVGRRRIRHHAAPADAGAAAAAGAR